MTKKCSYCGKEYNDEAAFCSIDGQPLGSEPARPRTLLHGSRRLWSGVGFGICCAVIGGLLEWQQQPFISRLGEGVIGFGLAWVVFAAREAMERAPRG